MENPPRAGDSERAGIDCLDRQSAHSGNRSERQVKPTLRPYQVDVVNRLNASIAAGHKRPLLVMVTGAGNTVVAALIIDEAGSRGGRVLSRGARR
jgi:superfamily II DNA or RNA helicase